MDVVEKIAAVPTVKDNGGSPYFSPEANSGPAQPPVRFCPALLVNPSSILSLPQSHTATPEVPNPSLILRLLPPHTAPAPPLAWRLPAGRRLPVQLTTHQETSDHPSLTWRAATTRRSRLAPTAARRPPPSPRPIDHPSPLTRLVVSLPTPATPTPTRQPLLTLWRWHRQASTKLASMMTDLELLEAIIAVLNHEDGEKEDGFSPNDDAPSQRVTVDDYEVV
ncbi:hypothetical protein PR202_gb26680 [Eleusine coracana subsp. coracana]|uniref:Uncharacterized protein n=1 Tax=Eleusine coracana subsp. coracana TaxID=191504 RepID=A0AAV5FS45_ELECO|nr:hypothetical protein PR202_gb26680 [Eleusine coracana subsp. coracana]